MAAATAMVHDLITSMKRAARHWESRDTFVPNTMQPPNRGNKLKRKDNPLAEAYADERPYKKQIEHASYQRHILHRNPRRFDDYGIELEDEDEDEGADQEAANMNPYGEVAIEKLLMPLTAAGQLESHPTLSVPYKSQHLHQMTKKTGQTLHQERQRLARLKILLIDFRGDHPWIPGGRFYTDGDANLFTPKPLASDVRPVSHGLKSIAPFAKADSDASFQSPLQPASVILEEAGLTVQLLKLESGETVSTQRQHAENPEKRVGGAIERPTAERLDESSSSGKLAVIDLGVSGDRAQRENELGKERLRLPEAVAISDADKKDLDKDGKAGGTNARQSSEQVAGSKPVSSASTPEEVTADEAVPVPRMVTRGQAQAQATDRRTNSPSQLDPATTTADNQPQRVHPLFRRPIAALPNRACGLPAAEADDTRRVLSALVQKQEELVRGWQRLYERLLRADRRARTVWGWCRAEAHVGDMSDGEDWVDSEEWGLDGPLKKGQEEPEETNEKKTRARRA